MPWRRLRHRLYHSADLAVAGEVRVPSLEYASLSNKSFPRHSLLNNNFKFLDDCLSHLNLFSPQFYDGFNLVNLNTGVAPSVIFVVNFEDPRVCIDVVCYQPG